METKRSIYSSLVCSRYVVLFTLVITTTCLWGCSSELGPPEALAENKIVRAKKFWRVDNKEELGDSLSFKQGEGYYAVIELEALPDRPDEVDGEKVTDPRLWLCVATCYPKGETLKSKRAIRFPVEPLFHPASAEFALFPLAPMGLQANSLNYKGPLKLHISSQPPDSKKQLKILAQNGVRLNGVNVFATGDKKPGADQAPVLKHKFDEGIIPYWMFLGDTHATPGEYTLEILAHPFFAGIKNLETSKSFQILRQAGFDKHVALDLSQKRGLGEIQKQIDWLPHRNPERNSLGMLRKAIQGDWSKPDSIVNTEKKQQRQQQDQKQATQEGIDEAQVSLVKREKKRRREQLLPMWDKLSNEERSQIEKQVFAELNSDFLQDRFKKNEEFRLNQCLDTFANQQQDDIASKSSETD